MTDRDRACLWPMWTKEMWRTIYESDEQQILPNSRYMFPFIQLINWITENQVLIHQPHGERESIYHLHRPLRQKNMLYISKSSINDYFCRLLLTLWSQAEDFINFLARKRIDLWCLLFLWFPTKIGLHLQQKITPLPLKRSNVVWYVFHWPLNKVIEINKFREKPLSS